MASRIAESHLHTFPVLVSTNKLYADDHICKIKNKTCCQCINVSTDAEEHSYKWNSLAELTLLRSFMWETLWAISSYYTFYKILLGNKYHLMLLSTTVPSSMKSWGPPAPQRNTSVELSVFFTKIFV